MRRRNYIVKKVARIFAWIIISLTATLLSIIAILQIPFVQKKITQEATAFLEQRIGTNVELEAFYISFPKRVVVKGFYLEDQQGDTLAYVGTLSIDTDLWAFLRNEVQLNAISMENTTLRITRAANDSAFNFSYIPEAFAGDAAPESDTSAAVWSITVRRLHLNNIDAQYADSLSKTSVNAKLSSVEVQLDRFDLEKQAFYVDVLHVSEANLRVIQGNISEQDTDSSAVSPDFRLRKADLTNLKLYYEDLGTGQQIATDIGTAVFHAREMNLDKKLVAIELMEIARTTASYHRLVGASTTVPDQSNNTGLESDRPWNISLEKLTLRDNSVRYYDDTQIHDEDGVDFDHLWLTGINIDCNAINSRGLSFKAKFDSVSFREKSGFAIQSMKGAIEINDDSATIDNFYLETGHSQLSFAGVATYESLDALRARPGKTALNISILTSHLGIQDLLFFSPNVFDSIPLKLDPSQKIFLQGMATGSVDEIHLHQLDLQTLADTRLQASGTIAGILEIKQPFLDLNIQRLYTTSTDIRTLVPDTVLSDSIAIPPWLNVNARWKGSADHARFNTFISTPYGNVVANGNINIDSSANNPGYSMHAVINDFNLGAVLRDTVSYGLLNAEVHLKGRQVRPDSQSIDLAAEVASFRYKGYNYNDLYLTGQLQQNVVRATASLNDENLDFTLQAEFNFQTDIPHYALTLDLQKVNFQALNLAERPLRARGTLELDLSTADMRRLNGMVGVRKVAIFNGDHLYAVDSLLFVSIDQEGRSEISIDSDLMDGRFAGSINVFTIPAVLREYFHTYYSLHDSVAQSNEGPQYFTFDLNLKKTELLTDIIVPELENFTPGTITGEFNSKHKRLDLKFEIPAMKYTNIGIDGFRFRSTSDSTELNYNLLVDQILVDSLLVDGFEFNGTVAGDSILTNIIIRDSLDYHKYVIGGTFVSRDSEFHLRLDPKQIILNYLPWSVPSNNRIRLGREKVIVENLDLRNNRQQITISSDSLLSSPLSFIFERVQLSDLTSMVTGETPVEGKLNGRIDLYTSTANPTFTADLRVDTLSIMQNRWGDIRLQVAQAIQGRYDVQFSLVGRESDIKLDGTYHTAPDENIALQAEVNRFNLELLQPVLQQQVTDLKGLVRARIRIMGTPDSPEIDGAITFVNTEFVSNYLRTTFRVDHETIRFDRRGIVFDKFELRDANDNKASLNGRIITDNYSDFQFQLNFTTEDFQLLNTDEDDNDLFYGLIHLNSEARIRGTLVNPVVNMKVRLRKGDHLTYIVPQEEASVLEQQGIVRFVDKSFQADPFTKEIQPELSDTVKTTFRGIDLTAMVELTGEETFTIILDPTTEDQLTVSGDATLTLEIDQTGDMKLAGRYEIDRGTYNFTFYKFVKREFEIHKGSSLTWTGDILNAEMNITALYEVFTAPVELMANQVSTNADLSPYRRRMPFTVYMNLGGQLLLPEINFRLDMPMSERNALGGSVYARLQDINTRESDLNKQVFALIVLKRFISEDPFENQAGSGFEGTARTSVSKILTNQLNQLSESVKGVELTFDVQSYEQYEAGETQGQTELQVGLSKKLLDDRLIIKLSGNIGIEGNQRTRDASQYIGDLSLEYLLTDDGRIRIQGFRNSDYDLVDGELIETGAGVIYIKDYNRTRDLFKSNAKTAGQ